MTNSWSKYSIPENLPDVFVQDPSLPLISIVTPSFNQGRFIRRTILSVLSQDYPNIEYWVIDGGSTDETLSILREFEDDPRFHWISENDKGQGDAVNKGWIRCRGELLGWLNSDDTYVPSALSRLGNFLINNPQVDMAYGDVLMITEEDEVIRRLSGQEIDLYKLFRRNYINQPAVLQRRRLIQKIGPLRTNLYYALDYDLYIRAALTSKIYYLDIICATYRIHLSSKTVSGGGRFTTEMAQVIFELLADENIPTFIKQKADALKSEWYAKMSLAYAQEYNYKDTLRFMLMALYHNPLQFKIYCVPFLVLDMALDFKIFLRLFDLKYLPHLGLTFDQYLNNND